MIYVVLMPTSLVPSTLSAFEQAARALIDAKQSKHTQIAYNADLSRWLVFCANHPADPLRPSIMDTTTFRNSLQAGLSGDSTRRVVAALSSIYRTLLAARVVQSNPFHPAVLAWPTQNRESKARLVDNKTAEAMIEHAEAYGGVIGFRDAALLRLLYDTGLRRASVAGLVRRDYAAPSLRAIVKGGKSVEINLADITMAALDRWLEVAPSSVYVFPGKRGPINVASINCLVKLHAVAVKAPHVHPHSFRAAFVTAGYDAELPEYEIQAGVHHKDPSTTRRYDRRTRGTFTAIKIAAFRKGHS